MGKLILGIIIGVLTVPALAYLYLRLGMFPAETWLSHDPCQNWPRMLLGRFELLLSRDCLLLSVNDRLVKLFQVGFTPTIKNHVGPVLAVRITGSGGPNRLAQARLRTPAVIFNI
jgi:hypothetical protein